MTRLAVLVGKKSYLLGCAVLSRSIVFNSVIPRPVDPRLLCPWDF